MNEERSLLGVLGGSGPIRTMVFLLGKLMNMEIEFPKTKVIKLSPKSFRVEFSATTMVIFTLTDKGLKIKQLGCDEKLLSWHELFDVAVDQFQL